MITINSDVKSEIAIKGYQCLKGVDISISATLMNDVVNFISSYNELEEDIYVKEKEESSYRYRRYGAFCLDTIDMKLSILHKSSFKQEKSVNSQYGGIERIFSPATKKSLNNAFLKNLILADFSCLPLTSKLKSVQKWFVGFHKIRIISNKENEGNPTPEGIHSDGHHFVVQHFINRENIFGGESQIYDQYNKPLSKIIFTDFLDSCFVDDEKVKHSVSPIKTNNSGYRDMLIVDFEVDCNE